MTKERRLAIQMWEEIAEQQPSSISEYKEGFCKEHSLDWENECWFCQYVRQDRRYKLPSRSNMSSRINGRQKCPIYRYNGCMEDACGCAFGIYEQAIQAIEVAERREAAEIIVRLLKGEKLWVTGEE